MVADLKGVIDVSIIRQCWKKVTSSVSQRDLSGYSPEEWCCLLTRTHGGNAKRRAQSPTECGCAAYESYSLYVWMIMNDSCCCWLVNDGLLSRMNWRKCSKYCDKSPEVGFVFTLKNKLAQDIVRSFSLFVQILCNLLEDSNRSKTRAHPGHHTWMTFPVSLWPTAGVWWHHDLGTSCLYRRAPSIKQFRTSTLELLDGLSNHPNFSRFWCHNVGYFSLLAENCVRNRVTDIQPPVVATSEWRFAICAPLTFGG